MFDIEDYVVVNKGIEKDINQDNIFVNGYYLSEKNNGLDNYTVKKNNTYNKLIYSVFDGIGGLQNGEYASYTCCNILSKSYNKESMDKILNTINQTLLKMTSLENIKLGTTASILQICGNKVIINQIGDSPIYILFKNNFIKLVEKDIDDDYLLPNYLGNSEKFNNNNKIYKLSDIDKIIICSDGLSKEISDLEINNILKQSDDVKFICEKLLNSALMNGGKDNISIIALKVKRNYIEIINIFIFLLAIVMIFLIIF